MGQCQSSSAAKRAKRTKSRKGNEYNTIDLDDQSLASVNQLLSSSYRSDNSPKNEEQMNIQPMDNILDPYPDPDDSMRADEELLFSENPSTDAAPTEATSGTESTLIDGDKTSTCSQGDCISNNNTENMEDYRFESDLDNGYESATTKQSEHSVFSQTIDDCRPAFSFEGPNAEKMPEGTLFVPQKSELSIEAIANEDDTGILGHTVIVWDDNAHEDRESADRGNDLSISYQESDHQTYATDTEEPSSVDSQYTEQSTNAPAAKENPSFLSPVQESAAGRSCASHSSSASKKDENSAEDDDSSSLASESSSSSQGSASSSEYSSSSSSTSGSGSSSSSETGSDESSPSDNDDAVGAGLNEARSKEGGEVGAEKYSSPTQAPTQGVEMQAEVSEQCGESQPARRPVTERRLVVTPTKSFGSITDKSTEMIVPKKEERTVDLTSEKSIVSKADIQENLPIPHSQQRELCYDVPDIQEGEVKSSGERNEVTVGSSGLEGAPFARPGDWDENRSHFASLNEAKFPASRHERSFENERNCGSPFAIGDNLPTKDPEMSRYTNGESESAQVSQPPSFQSIDEVLSFGSRKGSFPSDQRRFDRRDGHGVPPKHEFSPGRSAVPVPEVFMPQVLDREEKAEVKMGSAMGKLEQRRSFSSMAEKPRHFTFNFEDEDARYNPEERVVLSSTENFSQPQSPKSPSPGAIIREVVDDEKMYLSPPSPAEEEEEVLEERPIYLPNDRLFDASPLVNDARKTSEVGRDNQPQQTSSPMTLLEGGLLSKPADVSNISGDSESLGTIPSEARGLPRIKSSVLVSESGESKEGSFQTGSTHFPQRTGSTPSPSDLGHSSAKDDQTSSVAKAYLGNGLGRRRMHQKGNLQGKDGEAVGYIQGDGAFSDSLSIKDSFTRSNISRSLKVSSPLQNENVSDSDFFKKKDQVRAKLSPRPERFSIPERVRQNKYADPFKKIPESVRHEGKTDSDSTGPEPLRTTANEKAPDDTNETRAVTPTDYAGKRNEILARLSPRRGRLSPRSAPLSPSLAPANVNHNGQYSNIAGSPEHSMTNAKDPLETSIFGISELSRKISPKSAFVHVKPSRQIRRVNSVSTSVKQELQGQGMKIGNLEKADDSLVPSSANNSTAVTVSSSVKSKAKYFANRFSSNSRINESHQEFPSAQKANEKKKDREMQKSSASMRTSFPARASLAQSNHMSRNRAANVTGASEMLLKQSNSAPELGDDDKSSESEKDSTHKAKSYANRRVHTASPAKSKLLSGDDQWLTKKSVRLTGKAVGGVRHFQQSSSPDQGENDNEPTRSEKDLILKEEPHARRRLLAASPARNYFSSGYPQPTNSAGSATGKAEAGVRRFQQISSRDLVAQDSTGDDDKSIKSETASLLRSETHMHRRVRTASPITSDKLSHISGSNVADKADEIMKRLKAVTSPTRKASDPLSSPVGAPNAVSRPRSKIPPYGTGSSSYSPVSTAPTTEMSSDASHTSWERFPPPGSKNSLHNLEVPSIDSRDDQENNERPLKLLTQRRQLRNDVVKPVPRVGTDRFGPSSTQKVLSPKQLTADQQTMGSPSPPHRIKKIEQAKRARRLRARRINEETSK